MDIWWHVTGELSKWMKLLLAQRTGKLNPVLLQLR